MSDSNKHYSTASAQRGLIEEDREGEGGGEGEEEREGEGGTHCFAHQPDGSHCSFSSCVTLEFFHKRMNEFSEICNNSNNHFVAMLFSYGPLRGTDQLAPYCVRGSGC